MSAPTALPSLPDNPSELTRWRVGLQLLLVLKDDPCNPDAGALLNEALDTGADEAAVARAAEDTGARRILEKRPSLAAGDLDLEVLRRYPAGTLGHALSQYYAANEIPFCTTQAAEHPIDYFSKRYRETHDIYHVVTGYGTDVVGEMELQACVMGNLGHRSPRLMLPLGFVGARVSDDFLGSSRQPVRVGVIDYYRRVFAAYRRGKRAVPLLDVMFEDHWGSLVLELRRRLIGRADP